MRTMEGVTATSCAFGCPEPAQDRFEYYDLGPAVWQFFRMRRPLGLGLAEHLRSLDGFLPAVKGISVEDKLAMAIGAYSVSRCIPQLKGQEHSEAAISLMRLHARGAFEDRERDAY